MPKVSTLPSLQVFEGLTAWGEVRLRPDHLDNQIYVELRRGGEVEWKPLYTFIAIGGRIAMRVLAEKNDRVLVYDSATSTFSDLAGTTRVRYGDRVQSGKDGKDDNSG